MASVPATHVIAGEFLAVEIAPRAFVTSTGLVITRLAATKWGGEAGLEIAPYSGQDTIEVSAELRNKAIAASKVEMEMIGITSDD